MAGTIVRRYQNTLTRLGLAPEVRGDGEHAVIGFEHEGTRYVLSVDAEDPNFLMVMTVYGLGGEALDEATSAIRARDVNALLKGVKVTPVPEDALVRMSVELFLEKAPPGPEVLARAISVLKLASHEFFRGMKPAVLGHRSRTRGKSRARRPG
jgi:hypothetical protein